MKSARIARASGGKMEKKPQETPESGDKDWDKDLDDKPEARTNAKKIDAEAEERKSGGKVAKKRGGTIAKKAGGLIKKNVGGVAGSAPAPTAARKPRKSGGSCDSNPFSSARSGTAPKGHSTPGSTE